MPSLVVLTPSYAPDVNLFEDLHSSVLRFTPGDTVHQVVVPDVDVALFRRFASGRCQVVPASHLLPRHFCRIPGWNGWLNLRRPIPPLRGWVAQQVLKLAAAERLEADCILVADSDVVLVRPVTAASFRFDSGCHFYRRPAGVHAEMRRHVGWHAVAREILGLPSSGLPLPDYIAPLVVWDPAVLHALLQRISDVSGRHWLEVLARRVDFSECILYGVFVDECREGEGVQVALTSGCLSYWDNKPLSVASAEQFVRDLAGDDVAVMLSAKSRTPLTVRRSALAHLHRADPR